MNSNFIQKGNDSMIKLQLVGKENGVIYWEHEFKTVADAEDKKTEFSHWEDKSHKFVIKNV
jgi:hypothetical protein